MLSIQVKEKVLDYAPQHELNEITELLTKKGLASFTASRDVPRVNDIKTTLLEVTNVARRQVGPCTLAMAAICASAWLIGLPTARR
jgi:hypothetical protein